MTHRTSAESPNVDPVLDPTYARDQAQRAFGAQLAVARGMADYGSQLFKRLVALGASWGTADLVIVGALFRHFLAWFDGCILALENGAVDASYVVLRSQFETRLYLRWLLDDPQRERWAQQYCVYDLRQKRDYARMLIPGTSANDAYVKNWLELFGESPTFPPERVAQARESERALDELLSSVRHGDINSQFTQARGGSARDPDWYKVGHGAPKNFYEIARRLNRTAEYTVFYRSLSYHAHSSRISSALSRDGNARIVFEPIRQVQDFPFPFNTSTSMAIDVFHRLLTRYRPDEVQVFIDRHKELWTKGLELPTVETSPVIVPVRT